MKLFKRPKWLRPREVDKPLYWAHLFIIAAVLELMVFLFARSLSSMFGMEIGIGAYFDMVFSWSTVIFTAMLGVADIISHTLLGLD